ncbi:SDR family oxidoreductase [Blastochloris viridis]|uniref:C signal n=1 Tax=Blastochloris viridis TaxID=1079 RepID=A0A0H5BNZ8_BLAVI|nr:SDR family oxidoreductase [Blastochloris viridis]ALK08222.1 C-factor [Blastochloris viridis]BAR98513.1 short-chain dehydrogenase/reductase SDR [Blastochloris viridis]CUU44144.1 C signal [Blastochloris viridis]
MASYLITGANRGIGLGIVEQLVLRGERVFVCARNPDVDPLAVLAGKHPGQVTLHRLDVTDQASVDALADAIAGQPLDVLINNAGIHGPERQGALDMDFEGFARTLAVNTLAPLRVSQALVSNLEAGIKPRIVMISSIMGQLARPMPGDVAYCTSKTALNKVMQALALELKDAGIAVAAVHPGWVKTDMGGPQAPLAVAESARNLIATIDALTLAQTGSFFNYDGTPLAW